MSQPRSVTKGLTCTANPPMTAVLRRSHGGNKRATFGPVRLASASVGSANDCGDDIRLVSLMLGKCRDHSADRDGPPNTWAMTALICSETHA